MNIQPVNSMFGAFTLNSVGISLLLGFESLLCFLACFFGPTTLLSLSLPSLSFSLYVAEAFIHVAHLFHGQALLVFVLGAGNLQFVGIF